jgi:hypothetical protein
VQAPRGVFLDYVAIAAARALAAARLGCDAEFAFLAI